MPIRFRLPVVIFVVVALALGAFFVKTNRNARLDNHFVSAQHRAVEDAQDSLCDVSIAEPAWGSGAADANPNGLFFVMGPAPKGSQSVTMQIRDSAQRESSFWTGNSDVAPEIFERMFALRSAPDGGSAKGASIRIQSALPFDVPEGRYTCPIVRTRYRRHTITFRHFLPEGEHSIGYNRDRAGVSTPKRHTVVFDAFAGIAIEWGRPKKYRSDSFPIFDPAAVPRLPPPVP